MRKHGKLLAATAAAIIATTAALTVHIGAASAESNGGVRVMPLGDSITHGTQVPGGYRPVGVDEIVAVAHRAGGLAVLAHPGRSKGVYAIPATAQDVASMAEAGLDGIEVHYPTHSAEQRALYAELTQRYGLLTTGGSDSHHPRQSLATWPMATCQAFLERVRDP